MEKNALGIGALIVVFVAVIVGIALLQGAADNVSGASTEVSVVNLTMTAGALNVPTAVTGYQGVDGAYTVIQTNGTAANATLASASVSGNKVLQLTALDAASAASKSVKITATLQPTGYIDDGATRSIAALIIIFAALAIAVVALTPVLRDKLLDMI